MMISDALTGYVEYLSGEVEYDGGEMPLGETFLSGELGRDTFDIEVSHEAPLGSTIENTVTGYSPDLHDPILMKESNTGQVEVIPESAPEPAIPEPATVIFIGLGLLGILVFVRRKLKKRR